MSSKATSRDIAMFQSPDRHVSQDDFEIGGECAIFS
jgi:hypothetical protein